MVLAPHGHEKTQSSFQRSHLIHSPRRHGTEYKCSPPEPPAIYCMHKQISGLSYPSGSPHGAAVDRVKRALARWVQREGH